MGGRVKGNDGEGEKATERVGKKVSYEICPLRPTNPSDCPNCSEETFRPVRQRRRGRRGDVRAAAISSRWTRNPMRLGASPAGTVRIARGRSQSDHQTS